MDGAADGAYDANPPPVGGLGNFKGVMLCNRPVDTSTSNAGPGDNDKPFKSMISATAGEMPGITPCRNFEKQVKTRGPSAALRYHVKWLKELQGEMRAERDQVEEDQREEEARQQRIKATCEKHREAVREMYESREIAIAEATGVRTRYVVEKEKAAAARGEKPKAAAPPKKPLWACTDVERDAAEQEEVDDLLNFAEGLDYDKYVGDLEFRQGMAALADRQGKLQKEQDAFKEALLEDFNRKAREEEAAERSTSAGGSPRGLEDGVEGMSVLGDLRSEYSIATDGRPRSASRRHDGPKEWDSSTAMGEERERVDHDIREAAEHVLDAVPQMRAIHSKNSVQKIIAKARQKAEIEPPKNLLEAMQRDGPVVIPVIGTSEDTLHHLHREVDPSQLPYLYRSPAV